MQHNSLIGDLSEQYAALSASSEALKNVSSELLYERDDNAEFELIHQLEAAAKKISENGLFSELSLESYTPKGIRAFLKRDPRNWKIITRTYLGIPPVKANRLENLYGTLNNHEVRYFLISDTGDVASVPGRYKSYTRSTLTPDNSLQNCMGFEEKYSAGNEPMPISFEDCLIEYEHRGLSCYKNIAAVMIEVLGKEVSKVVESKQREVKLKEISVKARF